MNMRKQGFGIIADFNWTVGTRALARLLRRSGLGLVVLVAVSACLGVQAHADPLPPCTANGSAAQELQDNCAITNPGGSVVYSGSTSATVSYATTTVTNSVTDFSTTLLALLNGVQVYSMTFPTAFGGSTVSSAITAEDATLLADGASFGSPSLVASSSTLASSVSTTPMTYSCQGARATGQTYITGASVTASTLVGPGTIFTGDCNTDTLFVNPGQTDINVNTNTDYLIPESITTTNTYLDSQTYEIAATSNSAAVTPEPACLELTLTGLGAIGWVRRRRWQRG